MFRGGYRLPFKLFGIPVRFDATFLLLLVFLTWVIGAGVETYVELLDLPIEPAPLLQGFTPWLLGLASALGLVVSVIIHELAHALTARRYGVEIKEITLWALGGIAQFSEMPKRPGAEAIVAIVGPIASLLLAGVFWVVSNFVGPEAPLTLFVVSYLTVINVVLALFNLLPALPLDGGRVLRSLLAMRGNYLRATRTSAAISRLIAILLGLYGFFTLNILLMAIAFFIFFAVQAETQYATVTETLEDVRVADIMTTDVVTVPREFTVREFIAHMFEHKHLGYPVVDDDGTVLGLVTLRDAQLADEGETVADIMSREFGTIRPDESAVEAFKRINEHGSNRLLVTDSRGRMLGLISSTDLVRIVQVRMVGQDVAPGELPSQPEEVPAGR